ncbi:32239_t:CDS:2, partial [Racocetra persica]
NGLPDSYPKGDPRGLTAERVLKKMKSKNILYHFGKINDSTEIMIGIFREIIGEFLVFDLKTTGGDPSILVDQFCKATCSAIFSSVTLTTTLRNSKSIYSLHQINLLEPDWITLPERTGKILCYVPPKTLAEVKDLAPQPFSVGAERYAYYALDNKLGQDNKLVIKSITVLKQVPWNNI